MQPDELPVGHSIPKSIDSNNDLKTDDTRGDQSTDISQKQIELNNSESAADISVCDTSAFSENKNQIVENIIQTDGKGESYSDVERKDKDSQKHESNTDADEKRGLSLEGEKVDDKQTETSKKCESNKNTDGKDQKESETGNKGESKADADYKYDKQTEDDKKHESNEERVEESHPSSEDKAQEQKGESNTDGNWQSDLSSKDKRDDVKHNNSTDSDSSDESSDKEEMKQDSKSTLMSKEYSEDGESIIYLGTPKKGIEYVNLQGDETEDSESDSGDSEDDLGIDAGDSHV